MRTSDKLVEDLSIDQTVKLLVQDAVRAEASDIHIEPRANFIEIRYRIDGVLKEIGKLPIKNHCSLVSHIKILSKLKIDEKAAPQAGKFNMVINNSVYALRVSTLPITDGEKIVMRLANESSAAATLETLGYWGSSLSAINRAITQPHGLILVTGFTDSGKSTTLFSILSLLNSPSVNISTIEDSVEHKIIGANQVQVNPRAGIGFATGLQAILQQDSNVIMIDEVRDTKTARLAVEAALTGRLVFAAFYASNATACLSGLLDMGIEPFLVASTVRAVVGQRLVRRLCPNCLESYTPDAELIQKIINIFGIENSSFIKLVHDLEVLARDNELEVNISPKELNQSTKELSTSESQIIKLWRPSANGCEQCNHTGYKNRVGIYEVLTNSSAIQKLIVSNSPAKIIQDQAFSEGMTTMLMDGFIKALRGQTSIEEIFRAAA